MKRKKKSLKFNKIKIAHMNSIKGGDEINDNSVIVACQSGNNCPPPPDEASAHNNPCSDGCIQLSMKDGNVCTLGCIAIESFRC